MQVNRLFQITYILLENRKVTAKELSDKLEVSQRTIYRDVEALSSAGIPIYMSKGKGGGISILPEFILNKAILTEKERIEIMSSLRAVNAVDLSESDSEAVLKKLKNILGSNEADWIEVDFSSWSNADREKEIFNTIKSAILSKRIIEIEYTSSKGQDEVRLVSPLKLYFKGQSWYMYSYCKLRDDYRYFKLRRIKKIQLTEENYIIADPKPLKVDNTIFNDEFLHLKLKINKSMAYRVYDELDNVRECEDGNLLVEFDYPKGPWLFSYLSSYGEHCEILEPKEIREEVIEKYKKILKKYL